MKRTTMPARRLRMDTLRAAAIALIALAAGGPAATAEADSASDAIRNLAGRWSGNGWVELNGGSRERLKCVVTYFVRSGGSALEQNLRCASTSYKIDAKGQLAVAGNALSGTWTENSYSTTGTVEGQVRTGGFNVVINGPSFSARMSVASGSNSQRLNITPVGLSVSKISVELVKG